MKTHLKLLFSLLCLLATVVPVFAEFPGNCLNFTSGAYVYGQGIPTSFSSGVTIEAWVYHTSLSPNIQRYFTVIGENMVIRLDEGRVDFYIKASSGVQYRIRPATLLVTGQWYHVAGTYDGTTMKLYVNGNLVGTETTSGGMYPITGGTYNIGNSGEPLIGKIDELRLWKVVRTQAEIANNCYQEIPLPEASLQSYWKFDLLDGQYLYDYCQHSHGTLVNATWGASTIPLTASVSGTISANTYWITPTVYVTGDVTINNGVTITIATGVTLKVTTGKKIVVKGNLIAEGTNTKRITFTENSPGAGWAGLSFDGTSSGTGVNSSLAYCIVEHAITTESGGNIRATAYPMLQLQNCIIRDGAAPSGGGLSATNNSVVKVINCLINSNTATQGGALNIGLSDLKLLNCTFADNVSSDGRAIYSNNATYQPVIRNSIFWANGSGTLANLALNNTQYCNIEGGYAGTGNINLNPEFTGEAGNPYKLSNTSYCINTGINVMDGVVLPATDLMGNPRIFAQYNPSDEKVDMGAYEHQGYLAPSNFSASDGDSNYPGYVQLLWEINPAYTPAPTGFRIIRSGSDLVTTTGQVRSYQDNTAVPGTIYTYQLQVLYGTQTEVSQVDYGYITPNGVISGKVKTTNNNPVMGVKVSLSPSAGNCLQLDSGSSSSINISNPQADMNQNFTLETWVKTTGQDLVLLNSGTHNLGINAAGLVQYSDGSNLLAQQDASVTVNDGAWHHIALVNNFALGRVFMYLDDVEAASDTTYSFGNYTLSDIMVPSGFTGYLDDIRIWVVARDSSDVVDAMSIVVPGNSSGLKGYWAMNEGTGTTLFDATNYAHNAVLSNCTWSSSDPGMSLGALTDGWGDYIISQIPYGVASTFTVTPSKPGHMFQPEQRLVTLSSSNIAANNVDFTDNSMIPISGNIKFAGTTIPVVNASIWVNGVQALPPVITDADGYYVLEVEHGTPCLVSAKLNEHTFNRVWNLGNVTYPRSNINFEDMFTTQLRVEVVGGNDSFPIGDFDVTLASVSYPLLYTENITGQSWPEGYINVLNLPPLNYNITVNPGSTDTFNLMNNAVFQNNKTQNKDLTNAVAAGDTLRFVWRAPLQIGVTWPDSLELQHFSDAYTDSLFYVLTQNEWYSVAIQAFEDYGYPLHPNQKSYLNDCAITINDEIGIKGVTTGTFADTTYVYTFVPYLPNIQSGYARQYQKMIEFTVTDEASNRTAIKTDWALNQGVKPLESTYVTVSPQLPLMILHDPPGDGSFSSFTSESSYTTTLVISTARDINTNVYTELHLGPDIRISTGTGFFNKETEFDFTADFTHGLEVNKKQTASKAQTYTLTTSEMYSTSEVDDIIGDGADVFVGAAFNLIWGITKVLSWDYLNEATIIDTSCMVTPDGFATVYIYTDSQIRNTVIPNLEALEIPDTTSANLWRSYLAKNEYNKAHAIPNPNHPGNYSFNAGPSYVYTQTNTKSVNHTIEYEQEVSNEIGVALGATLDGLGGGLTVKVKTAITLGATGSIDSTLTTTSTFTLADDDITSDLTVNSDYFSVDVGVDPVYATPVFNLVSGASSNHWEPNTQPRDGVMMTANTYTASDLPMGSPAAFLLYLSNTSQANEARRYFLEVMHATNPIGATVKINGATLVGPMAFDLEAGQTIQAVLTVEPGPWGYELDDLTLEFYAAGDRGYKGPTDHYFDIYKSFDIAWEAPYSRVAIRYPQDNWLINQALNDTLNIVLQDYDLSKEDFKSIKLQYKQPQSTDWLPAFEVMRDVLENHPNYISVPWDVSALADGIYEIRAATTDSIQVDWFTDAITGTIDRSSPVAWGLPQPADGVLELGDLISLTFTEDIDPNSVMPGCVSVSIPRTTMAVDVNVQVNGSSVSIVPNIANFWLENETVLVKVEGLKDLCGNAMADSVQWEFYVNANPVAWVQPKLEIIKPLGQAMQITTYLNNSGGQTSSFTITDLPDWLTVDNSSGTLLPLSAQTLVFSVSNQLGYGAFRDTVYAFIPGLGNEPLIFEINVLANPPAWATTQLDNFDYSMTITGQLQMEGEISSDTNDIIAAFVLDANNNYACRGYANLQSVPYLPGAYQFFLTINSNQEDGEELLFRVWDSSTNKEHFGITEQYIFISGQVYGTPLSPVIIHVSPQLIRSIPCRNGWNWVSVNLVNPAAMDVNTLLGSLTPTANDVVKNHTDYDQFVPGMGWVGSLEDISTTGMVKLKLANPDQLELTGLLENPVTTPVTYGVGWNWIGYLPHVSISVNQALANMSAPVTGDLVKSQNGYSQYIQGYGWFGSLLFMDAGKGYMLNSASAGSFTYPDYVIPREETITLSSENFNNLRELTGWDVNPLEYEFSSNITAVVQNNSGILNNENILLGAFYGDECRGVATPVRVLDQWVFFLTQYSNTLSQQITYKVYLADSDEVINTVEALPFVNNQILGDPLHPYTFHIISGSLDIPLNVRLEIAESTLTLSWDTVPGAESYKIFASDSPEGEYIDVSSRGRSIINNGGKPDISRNSGNRTRQSWSCEIPEMQRKFYYIKASTDIP